MKYRITERCHLNDPFVLVSEQIEDPGTGEIRDIKRGWERWSCLVDPGSVVEISDKIIPGPYMDAVDAEGEAHIQRHIAHARSPIQRQHVHPAGFRTQRVQQDFPAASVFPEIVGALRDHQRQPNCKPKGLPIHRSQQCNCTPALILISGLSQPQCSFVTELDLRNRLRCD